ncbi:MAG: hypothetical protein WA116_00970 [Anaerolineaceae bacterium]
MSKEIRTCPIITKNEDESYTIVFGHWTLDGNSILYVGDHADARLTDQELDELYIVLKRREVCKKLTEIDKAIEM